MDQYQKLLTRLRAIRERAGLTLKAVEVATGGAIRASTISAYERGVRAPTLERALEILEIYGSSLADLAATTSKSDLLTLDIRQLRAIDASDLFSKALQGFVRGICTLRGDWNGEVITLRATDVQLIQIITETNGAEFEAALNLRNLIFTAKYHL